MAIAALTLTVDAVTPVMVAPSARGGAAGSRVVISTSGPAFAAGNDQVAAPDRVSFSDANPLPELTLDGNDELWVLGDGGTVTIEVLESGV